MGLRWHYAYLGGIISGRLDQSLMNSCSCSCGISMGDLLSSSDGVLLAALSGGLWRAFALIKNKECLTDIIPKSYSLIIPTGHLFLALTMNLTTVKFFSWLTWRWSWCKSCSKSMLNFGDEYIIALHNAGNTWWRMPDRMKPRLISLVS